MEWRRVSSLSLPAALAVALLLAACGQSAPDVSRDAPEAIARLVESVTTGPLASGDSIVVRFLEPQVGGSEVGQAAHRGLLTVSPAVRGTVSWADERTLSLAPSRPLTPGAEYTARVDLRRLDPEQQPFVFSFLVVPREIAELEARFVPVATVPGTVRYQGSLRLTEPVEIPAIRRDASLVVDGSAVPLAWSGAENGLSFEFVSKPIARDTRAKDYEFLVQADRDLSAQRSGRIPALDVL